MSGGTELLLSHTGLGFPYGTSGKEPACQCRRHETQVQSLGREDPLENGMATHSSILAWRIPWTEEPGGLQSMGSHRVRHNWSNLAHMHTHKRTHAHRLVLLGRELGQTSQRERSWQDLGWNLLLGLSILWEKNLILQKRWLGTRIFTAALITIAKMWKQLKCPSTEEGTECVHPYNAVLLCHRKEENSVTCYSGWTLRTLKLKSGSVSHSVVSHSLQPHDV